MKKQNRDVFLKNEQKKPKQRKKGKNAKVYRLHQKGVSVKEIADKMKPKERVVRDEESGEVQRTCESACT